MSDYDSLVTTLVQSSICKSEFQEYQNCMKYANSKKKQQKCNVRII